MNPLSVPALTPGKRIGLIAPAGPVSLPQVEQGIQLLEAYGLKVEVGRHAFSDNGITSAPEKERLEDIIDFYQNPAIHAIWALRGGYGTIQLLEMLDFSILAQHPKLLIGFSDVTALQWAIYQQIRMPMASGLTLTLQVNDDNRYLGESFEILSGQRLSVSNDDLIDDEVKVFQEGYAEGTLIGGTLSMICTLCGSPFWLKQKNLIVYLEDVSEPLYRIDRCLRQLQLAGFWEQVSGVILGKYVYNDGFVDALPLITPLLPKDIPIVYDFPYGHFGSSFLLPVGVEARLDTSPFKLQWQSFFQQIT